MASSLPVPTFIDDAAIEVITEQAHRIKAACQVIVDGRDVTSIWDPHLLQLTVTLYRDSHSQCTVVLDDRDASLGIPGREAPVQIALGWQSESMITVFTGKVFEVDSAGDRASGRTLTVLARGASTLSKLKERQNVTMGEGQKDDGQEGKQIPLSDFLQKVAGNAGLSIDVHSAFASVKRDFWSAYNESFQMLGQRLARELGGTFSVDGDQATFNPIGNGDVSAIKAEWDNNLISWRIKPFAGLPQYKSGKQDTFDIPKGIWDIVEKAFGGSAPFGQSTATTRLPSAAPNKQVGSQQNEGLFAASNDGAGTGFVNINGEPGAFPNNKISVIGARPGVDGLYTMDVVEHTYLRGGGFGTHVQVVFPELVGPGGGPNYYQQQQDQGNIT